MLKVVRNTALPPLAWHARIEADTAQITCGDGVKIGKDWIFEGAWAHTTGRLSAAIEVFGSGLELLGRHWSLIPPSHLLECIYVLHGDAWHASNSLAFLKAQTGYEFEIRAEDVLVRLAKAAGAISTSPVSIPTRQGTLYPLYHHNAELAHELIIKPKPDAPRFDGFEDYRRYLLQTLEAVQKRDNRPFLATVSSGYDLVACASMVKSLGGREALSFGRARGGSVDSGAAAARALGLNVVEFDRPLAHDPRTSDLFMCCGLGGEDALYAALHETVRKRVFVTGFHGDKIWDLHTRPNCKLARGDLSGASLAEFRLRQDFVHVPAPFIGGRNHSDLTSIGRSPSMRPYSVGGAYDRPIPRRIAEDAGVPRQAFGRTKKAVSLPLEGDWAGVSAVARLQYKSGIAVWRLLHGSARRLWLPLRATALDLAEAVFFLIFRRSFAVFEHCGPNAVRPFESALAAVSDDYRNAVGADVNGNRADPKAARVCEEFGRTLPRGSSYDYGPLFRAVRPPRGSMSESRSSSSVVAKRDQ